MVAPLTVSASGQLRQDAIQRRKWWWLLADQSVLHFLHISKPHWPDEWRIQFANSLRLPPLMEHLKCARAANNRIATLQFALAASLQVRAQERQRQKLKLKLKLSLSLSLATHHWRLEIALRKEAPLDWPARGANDIGTCSLRNKRDPRQPQQVVALPLAAAASRAPQPNWQQLVFPPPPPTSTGSVGCDCRGQSGGRMCSSGGGASAVFHERGGGKVSHTGEHTCSVLLSLPETDGP